MNGSISLNVNSLMDTKDHSVQNIIVKYQKVFSDRIGKCTTHKFKLFLKDNAKAVCCKPRPVPFAMRKRVDKEIAKLIDCGILEQTESSK